MPTRRLARLLVFAITLALLELSLQLLARLSVRVQAVLNYDIPYSIPDPVLGGKGNPKHPEHDSAGYRNRERLTQADIVVLGDSHAYGVAVTRDEAWPHVLARTLGQRVYNMGYSGYTAPQHWLQLPEALALHPKRLIVSVYVGNDFVEAFGMLRNPTTHVLAPPELLKAGRNKEAERPLHLLGNELYHADATASIPPGRTMQAREWLSAHSRLYGFARAVKRVARPSAPPVGGIGEGDFDTIVPLIPPDKLQYWTITDQPHWRTILTSRLHAFGVDDSDVRIRLGVEIVKRALIATGEQATAAGADVLIVLLPTKDAVFWPHTPVRDGVLPQLVANETRLKQELIDELTAHRINVIDATTALQAAPEQPYFETADSHPNALGHRVIADVVAKRLSSP